MYTRIYWYVTLALLPVVSLGTTIGYILLSDSKHRSYKDLFYLLCITSGICLLWPYEILAGAVLALIGLCTVLYYRPKHKLHNQQLATVVPHPHSSSALSSN